MSLKKRKMTAMIAMKWESCRKTKTVRREGY